MVGEFGVIVSSHCGVASPGRTRLDLLSLVTAEAFLFFKSGSIAQAFTVLLCFEIKTVWWIVGSCVWTRAGCNFSASVLSRTHSRFLLLKKKKSRQILKFFLNNGLIDIRRRLCGFFFLLKSGLQNPRKNVVSKWF